MKESANVALDGADAHELMSDEVCVMRRRNEVLRDRPRHILPDRLTLLRKRGVVGRVEEPCETFNRQKLRWLVGLFWYSDKLVPDCLELFGGMARLRYSL